VFSVPAAAEVQGVVASRDAHGRRPLARALAWGLLVVGAAALVWWAVSRGALETPSSGESAPRPVSVVAVKARRGDVEIHLTGLGMVTAFNTVTLHSRVEGELVNVAFTEGQLVHEGDLLVEIDRRPFEVQLLEAQGTFDRDQAQLENARINLERLEAAKNAVSRQEIDTQAALVRQIEGSLKTDRAQIENARLQLTYCRITSPFTGVIGLRLVDKGNIVHPNDASGLAVIEQVQPIAVVFTLPEDDLPLVLGNKDKGSGLPVEAFDREQKEKLASGTVLTLDNRVDPSTGTIKVKARFPNEDEELFPNQFVNARLRVDTRRGVVLVPAGSIQVGPRSPYVFAVRTDGTVEQRPVVPGPTEGGETVIERGVAAGDTVVTEGVDKLRQGTKVIARIAEGQGRTAP
jgi:multidrug efflux system membrane fusion protein